MSLDTYTNLKAAAALWLNREDLTAQIPDFITLAEAYFNRKLRTLQMEKIAYGTSTDDGQVPVPCDWLETRTFRLQDPTTGSVKLDYVGEEEWDDLNTRGLTGRPRYYTIINAAFQILPAPAASPAQNYTLRYYSQIPSLSDDNTCNWLLIKSPDLYLYSTLLAAEAYMKDDERLPIWKGIQDQILEDMRYEGEQAKRSATRLVARRLSFG